MEPKVASPTEQTPDAAAVALDTGAASPEKPGLLNTLLARRIPQIAGVYLGVVWSIFQFVRWLINRFVLSPYLEDVFMLTALLLAPTVLALAYFHGAKGKQRWTRTEKLFIPCNVLLAVVALFIVFGGKDLGSAQETVTMVDAEGNATERVIPKSEFRKRLAVFPFTNKTGNDDLAWLEPGLPEMVGADLSQDPFLITLTGFSFDESLRQAGFEDGLGAPLALQRQIAEKYNLSYVLTGSIDQQDDRYRIETTLYRVKSGKAEAAHTAEGTDVLALADQIATQLKHDLDVPQQHLEETVDMPVNEVLTNSVPALRAFVRALQAQVFGNDHQGADALLQEAITEDPTFARAHLQRFSLLFSQNRLNEAVQALGTAQQHNYRLSEQDRFRVTTVQFFFTRQPDEAVRVARQWSTLYPEDTGALDMLYRLHIARGENDEALAALQRLDELDPASARQLQIGDLLRSKGQYDDAMAQYQAYLDRFPKKKDGYERLALIHRAQGNLDQEQATHRQALAVAPNDPVILANLGETMMRLGNFDEAEAQYKTALTHARTPSQQYTVQQKLALYYALRGDYTQTLEAFEPMWAYLGAYQPPIRVVLLKAAFAPVYVEADRADRAEAFLAEAKAQPSYQADDLYTVNVDFAWCFLRLLQEQKEGVVEVFERSNETLKAYGLNEVPFNLIRGLIYQRLDRFAEAAVAYEAYLDRAPDQENGWLGFGQVRYEMGQLDDARQLFEQAATLFPSHPEAHLGLGKIAIDQERNDDARRHLDQALIAWAIASPNHEEAQEVRQLLEALP